MNKVDFKLPIGTPSSAMRTYIMQALGWKVESYKFQAGDSFPTYTCWKTIDPEGEAVGPLRLYNEADAWDLVPNWPAKIEDAETLIPCVERHGYRCAIFLGASGLWCCEFLPDIEKPIQQIQGADMQTLSEAISMAFIIWHASKFPSGGYYE